MQGKEGEEERLEYARTIQPRNENASIACVSRHTCWMMSLTKSHEEKTALVWSSVSPAVAMNSTQRIAARPSADSQHLYKTQSERERGKRTEP